MRTPDRTRTQNQNSQPATGNHTTYHQTALDLGLLSAWGLWAVVGGGRGPRAGLERRPTAMWFFKIRADGHPHWAENSDWYRFWALGDPNARAQVLSAWRMLAGGQLRRFVTNTHALSKQKDRRGQFTNASAGQHRIQHRQGEHTERLSKAKVSKAKVSRAKLMHKATTSPSRPSPDSDLPTGI